MQNLGAWLRVDREATKQPHAQRRSQGIRQHAFTHLTYLPRGFQWRHQSAMRSRHASVYTLRQYQPCGNQMGEAHLWSFRDKQRLTSSFSSLIWSIMSSALLTIEQSSPCAASAALPQISAVTAQPRARRHSRMLLTDDCLLEFG